MFDSSTAILRSPFGASLGRISPEEVRRSAGVSVAEWASLACLVLRGQASDPAFMGAVQDCLGVALPTAPSTFVSTQQVVALWLSPDEWWLLMPRAQRSTLHDALRSALADVFAQVADNSGGLACMRLAGPHHVTLLRHLSPYDFDRLGVGKCVSTVIPRATVTVVRSDDTGVMLVCRRSFANWVWSLVERSAQPYGLAVCEESQLPAAVFSQLSSETPARPTAVSQGAHRESQAIL